MSQYDQVQYKEQHLYEQRKFGNWLRKQENCWKTFEFLKFLKNQVVNIRNPSQHLQAFYKRIKIDK